MPHLKYYDNEAKRWPQLYATKLTPEEALIAVAKLVRHFGTPDCAVQFTSGSRISKGFSNRILLNVDCLNWLLVAHEFAHFWDGRHDEERRIQAIRQTQISLGRPQDQLTPLPPPHRPHDKFHARLVDRACRYIVKQRWNLGEIAHGLALKKEHVEEKVRLAAKPPPIEVKIAKREEQIARLTKRIKSLTTRRQSAERSLAVLRRFQAKRSGS